ncbi:protein croquemort-like [Topomyia yanbarensis]|uniref:protein croquemort-like n=1 Tax=Topomyia yanbarensis TaxID=2498891 RepID=UPI00273C809D|nr:protein croquemort-like [Topomyia yanbarensis]
MCSRCSNKAKQWWSIGISALICVLALVFGVAWPLIVRSETEKLLLLQPGSQVFENWKEPPVPMYLEIYLWNWTNTEDYRSDGYKPRLEQLGPYTFREIHERVDLQWNDDFTLSFYQKRIWHYEPQLSTGDLENDIVISINPILLTVGFATKDNPLQSWLDLMINASPHVIDSPFYVVRAKEILFEGHDDYFLESLLYIVEQAPEIIGDVELPPFDKFGWFYERNESKTYDGKFTVGTGVDAFETMGMMHLWNNVRQTVFYRGECGLVHGSTGEIWPPFQEYYNTNVTVFSPDICSSMSLEFDGDFSLHGVDGFKWKGNERPFDNGHRYIETECQCTAPKEECPVLAPGVLDVSRCKWGAPATVSYPHFYLADQTYRDAVDGMNPDKEQHEFVLALEPHTGVPLTVKAQLQVNLMVKQYGLTLLEGIPDVMLPILWFRQRADLSEELANDIKLLLILPDIGMYIGIGLGVVGAICLGLALYFSLIIWRTDKSV